MRKRLIRKGAMGELFGGTETIKEKEREKVIEDLRVRLKARISKASDHIDIVLDAYLEELKQTKEK